MIGVLVALAALVQRSYPDSNEVVIKQRQGQHIAIEGASVRSLVPGRSLFADHSVQWRQGRLEGFDSFVAVTDLNRIEPLIIKTQTPGYLYALLWQWDFGIVSKPSQPQAKLLSWELVEPLAGHLTGYVPPLSPIPLYRRPISAGTHELKVCEYFGQWVLVGFAEDDSAKGQTTAAPQVELANSRTEHNIYDPGEQVRINTKPQPYSITLFGHGKLTRNIYFDAFNAPAEPGRYWLELKFADASRIVPLTVGYGPASKPGWDVDEFFPIHAYVAGLEINANPARSGDLNILAQFDAGFNTFFVSRGKKAPPPNPVLIDALGCRRLYETRSWTRWSVRHAEDDETAVSTLLLFVSHFPPVNNALGFYVEDEPPRDTRERMGLIEQRFAQDYGNTNLHLLYCLVGGWSTYWEKASTATGMFRAYPFTRELAGDLLATREYTEEILLRGIDNWRAHAPDRPLWLVVQVFSDSVWAVPTVAQVRLLCNLALARGVKALTYFGCVSARFR